MSETPQDQTDETTAQDQGDLGPMPEPSIEPGEPNPGGADALDTGEQEVVVPDLPPESNPATEDSPVATREREDTSTKATRSPGGEDEGPDADDEDAPV